VARPYTEHRGACSADNDSGDGAGIMCNIPWQLLEKYCAENNIAGFKEGSSGVGMVFLPQDPSLAFKAKDILNKSIAAEGLTVLGWRPVPVDKTVVGRMAKDTEPVIEQVLVSGAAGDDLERKLYLARKTAEKAAAKADAMAPGFAENFYVCTMSGRTIVYKVGTSFTRPHAGYDDEQRVTTSLVCPTKRPCEMFGDLTPCHH